MLRILLLTLFTLSLTHCKDKSIPLPFGAEIRMMPVDTTGHGSIDTTGYYIPEKGSYRVIYIEIDKNGNGSSDEMIWQGSATYQDPNTKDLKTMVKVHEEVDENHDGKIDLIRWMLPNDFIAISQKDSDHDGFFESTQYYNYKKIVVKREVDSKKQGFPTIFIYQDRAEIDSDSDKVPDLVVFGKSELELEEKATNLRDVKPLKKDASYFLNPKLLPLDARPIIGGNY
ncbi:MAG: hypothetical protein SH817_10855 [Leptospira sp.]|nr:hypothetical protein [Leptospira sp.]